jgi:DNA-directed RNA polymerase subunit RPC12/RpoP
MKKDKKINHKYLINLYHFVGDYLASSKNDEDDLPAVVVSFCTVCEKIFKLMLYEKNPVLIFSNKQIKEDDALISIAKKINTKIETIKMRDVINRFKLFFENKFSENEMQFIISLYDLRNELVHGYIIDEKVLVNPEDIVKKMGTVWGKVSEEASRLFGKNEIKYSKPKRKYAESELDKVLTEEVRKKIKNKENYLLSSTMSFVPEISESLVSPYAEKRCPRCGSYSFILKKSNDSPYESLVLYSGMASLYLCAECGLELTQKEYEIAKKIKTGSL